MIPRTCQIGWVAAGVALTAAMDRLSRSRRPARLPARLRLSLEGLGPTFVKLGQALSQRRDLMPEAWIVELSRLQESVPPFPGTEAQRIVEAALGAPVEQLFARFEIEPMAAASVAQVHRAQLPDGREVVVKVLRPGVRAQIDQDMRILLALVRLVTVLVPGLRRRRTPELVRELWRNLRLETDLLQEARNIRRFARAFAASPSVYIPEAIEGLCASQVLVQAFSPGRHFDDAALKPDAERLARAFIDFYMAQFFGAGVFHADPHPGNIFVMGDGRLCFHDFGAVGWLGRGERDALMSFVQGFVHQDPAWLTQAAVDLGLITRGADRAAVAQGVEAILQNLAGAPLQDWSIARVMLAVARLGGGEVVALPPHLAALVRTVFTAEGSLRLLDPGLDVVQALARGGADLRSQLAAAEGASGDSLARLKWEAALAARGAPGIAAQALHRLQDPETLALPLRLTDVPQALGRLAAAADRIALALVTLGLYIAASLLMQHSIGPRILGNLPLLAALGYGLALWFTFKLVRGVAPGGRR